MMDKEKLATVLDLNENIEFLWEKEIPCCDLIVSDILLEIGLDAQIPVTHEVNMQNYCSLKYVSLINFFFIYF